MTKKDYFKILDKRKYQVFLFNTRANMPFSIASHNWFVLNKMGEVSRWDVGITTKYKTGKGWGHLYENLYPPTQGLEVFPFWYKLFWGSHLIDFIEGEEALKIISFVEDSPNTYPYKNTYHLLGPNSNTYTQWIINNFPASKLKLPIDAIGKNFIV